ncbi:hypothetical protein DQM14_00580 [Limosilactobacillus fermentum]|uniref:hypothetical protein n=1 Tax=Limosilactobacillus fermentum TaxID=1613 RepID=UPI000E0917B7|nr:hypothetical protein [Limosilactobacillus fermentum]MCT3440207.1 hypothetical protein [Limosilactobacillus fermentum]RDG21436.1 hypothetical protein DQM14_00580 [Limosilactobacillus fermentum]
MDLSIKKLLKRYDVKIEYTNEVEFTARLFNTPKGMVIIMRSGMPEEMENQVVLHEIGHIKNDGCQSYQDWRSRIVMEKDANEYMLDKVVGDYIDSCDPIELNSIDFLEHHNLSQSLDHAVRNLIRKNCPNSDDVKSCIYWE